MVPATAQNIHRNSILLVLEDTSWVQASNDKSTECPGIGGFVPKAFRNSESARYEFLDYHNKSKLSSLHGTRSRVFHAHFPKFGLKYLKALTRTSETIKTFLLRKGKRAEGEDIDMLS